MGQGAGKGERGKGVRRFYGGGGWGGNMEIN